MEIKEAIKIVERHNEWRRGAEIDMTDPVILGQAMDKVIKYVKEKENIEDNIIRIIINFEDLAYKDYFQEAGIAYCRMANMLLKNSSNTQKEIIERFTDPNYIKVYFTSSVIGNFIKNYPENMYWEDITKSHNEVIDEELFKQIKEYVEYMISNTHTLPQEVYENMMKYNDGSNDSMYLIIEFNNNEFRSFIF